MSKLSIRMIKSAHRVLEILEYFDRNNQKATVMDLSRALSYPQSSTSELLRCLSRLGYLHYDRYERTYRPTARVALLGAWVEPKLFRGGAVLSLMDHIADLIGETVVLSTAASYVVQHIHVINSTDDDAVISQTGAAESLLHSPVGKLLLSTYKEAHIRSALHRLNAEEADPATRVRMAEHMEEIQKLSGRGWSIVEDSGDGTGSITVLMPPTGTPDRLAISVLARSETIASRGMEIVRAIESQRNQVFPNAMPRPAAVVEQTPVVLPTQVRLRPTASNWAPRTVNHSIFAPTGAALAPA